MSDERKEWLLKHVEYVFNACRLCSKFLACECSKCPKGEEACDQARVEIKRLIQQKPEIDDMEKYIKEKATYMFEHEWKRWILDNGNASKEEIIEEYTDFITQIVSDVKGRGK